MVIPEWICTNSWIASWSKASWKVDPDPLSVADASLTVVADPPPVVAVEALLELPQAPASRLSPATAPTAASRGRVGRGRAAGIMVLLNGRVAVCGGLARKRVPTSEHRNRS